MKLPILAGCLTLATALVGCVAPRVTGPIDRATEEAHQLLARGVTLSCPFDRPDDATWVELQRSDVFREMRRAGFTAVRIPIDFMHAQREANAPGAALHDAWLARVERVVRQAVRGGLAVVVVARLNADISDTSTQARLTADWGQLAWQLRKAHDCVYFELLENPDSSLTDAAWSRLAEEIRLAIRLSNPNRILLVGPAQRYNPLHLSHLDLPPDPHLLFAFAYDEPVTFTHQGDPDVRGSEAWRGNTWTGTEEETQRIEADLDRAARWAREHNRKLVCVSFSCTARADPAARVQWTYFVARALEERDISWCYQYFGGSDGLFDPEWHVWRQPLLGALLNK